MKWRLVGATIGVVLSAAGGALGQPEKEPQRFEIRLVGPNDAQGLALRSAVAADLQRTPRRLELTAVATQTFEADAAVDGILALLALEVDPALARPSIELAQWDEGLSPGWLVHSILQAGSTVGVGLDVGDRRSSLLGQLVRRSTRSLEPCTADAALAHGVPAVRLVLPSSSEPSSRLLAAVVRRLGGLDGFPVFEDEFLVVGARVLLRRDLYWLGLAVWLALYWRGRNHPGREFRWLLLAAWLVSPVYASLLLLLPALVASWRPASRWPAAVALLPSVAFAALLASALAGPAVLRLSVIPALLTTLALAAFVWHHLVGLRQPEAVAPA